MLWLTGTVEKEISSIERVVTQELKGRAVKLIAATLGDQIDHGALRLTVFRAETIALDTKLFDRIDGGKHK